MTLVDGSNWQACVGGLASKPAETKLSLAGGDGAPGETWTLTVIGTNASSSVISCNTSGVTCAFSSQRVVGTSTTKYVSTATPFDIKVSTWTAGAFIGTLEMVEMAKTVAVPGQVDQSIVSGITVVVVATGN